MKENKLLDLQIHDVTFTKCVEKIIEWSKSPQLKPRVVSTINVDYFLRALSKPYFKNILNQSDLSTVDGVPVLWVGHLLGVKFKERIAGSDLFPKLLSRCEQDSVSTYILGGTKEVSIKCESNIRKKYPNLKCNGFDSSFVYLEGQHLNLDYFDNDAIVRRINQSDSDILFLCLGSPKSEIWIRHNLSQLNVKAIISVGAAIDFMAEVIPRAPRWMQRMGFEWFFRLMKEPKRLSWRYLKNICGLFALVIRCCQENRLKRRGLYE